MISNKYFALLHSKRSKFTWLLLFVGVIVSLLIQWYGYFYDYEMHRAAYPTGINYREVLSPEAASFLSGNSTGHFVQILIIWLFPIYCILLLSQRSFGKQVAGSIHQYLSRGTTFTRMLIADYVANFTLVFIIFMIIFVFDYFVSSVIFRGGQSFMDMETYINQPGWEFLKLQIIHPQLTYLLCIFVTCLCFGTFAVLIEMLALILKNQVALYAISMVIWLVFLALPMSSTSFMQPFTEIQVDVYLSSIAVYFITCILIIVGGSLFILWRVRTIYVD